MVKCTIVKRIIIVLAFAVMLTGCSIGNAGKNSISDAVETESFIMGTVVTQKVYGLNQDAAKAANEVINRLRDLEDRFTINKPGGEINQLNAMAGKQAVPVSEDTVYVLEKARKYAELSGGAFDVTIGPLVEAWGIFTDHPKVPPETELYRLQQLVNFNDLTIDPVKKTAKLARPGQVVDLGGIAKGFGGDEAVKIYKKHGITSAIANLGGNVVALGSKPDRTLWHIGIRNPRGASGTTIGTVKVKNRTVVTSGDYERFFMKNGVRYHHILDAKTGYPAESGLISTSIVAHLSVDADALSTATFVLGLDKGMKLIESLKGVEAIFVTSDKKVYTTSGLKGIFTFEDESGEFQYVEKR